MKPAHDDDFGVYAAELKTELWGSSPEDVDPYYDKYSPVTGGVIDGWSMAGWLDTQWAGIAKTTGIVTRAGMRLRGMKVPRR